jgi:NAD(P)H-dependent FMN reductase
MPLQAVLTPAQHCRSDPSRVYSSKVSVSVRPLYSTTVEGKVPGAVVNHPGGAGTARGQMALRQILLHAPAYVLPEPQMLIPYSREKFDVETGDLIDEQTRERMRRFLDALVEWTERLATRQPPGAGDRRD